MKRLVIFNMYDHSRKFTPKLQPVVIKYPKYTFFNIRDRKRIYQCALLPSEENIIEIIKIKHGRKYKHLRTITYLDMEPDNSQPCLIRQHAEVGETTASNYLGCINIEYHQAPNPVPFLTNDDNIPEDFYEIITSDIIKKIKNVLQTI